LGPPLEPVYHPPDNTDERLIDATDAEAGSAARLSDLKRRLRGCLDYPLVVCSGKPSHHLL
jgi:hypothetical protein